MRAVIAGSTGLIGRNQAFNIVNGDIFRWRWHWPRLDAPIPGCRFHTAFRPSAQDFSNLAGTTGKVRPP